LVDKLFRYLQDYASQLLQKLCVKDEGLMKSSLAWRRDVQAIPLRIGIDTMNQRV